MDLQAIFDLIKNVATNPMGFMAVVYAIVSIVKDKSVFAKLPTVVTTIIISIILMDGGVLAGFIDCTKVIALGAFIMTATCGTWQGWVLITAVGGLIGSGAIAGDQILVETPAKYKSTVSWLNNPIVNWVVRNRIDKYQNPEKSTPPPVEPTAN